jgi:hypothetical protein
MLTGPEHPLTVRLQRFVRCPYAHIAELTQDAIGSRAESPIPQATAVWPANLWRWISALMRTCDFM